MQFSVYSYRKHGEPKLNKPKELKGIKQDFSEDYIPGKCKFAVFADRENDQLWIQARDWFSPSWRSKDPEDFGAPMPVLLKKYNIKGSCKGFVYPDCWGDIVLRSEAWIRFDGVFKDMEEWEDRRWRREVWLPMQVGIVDEMCRCIERHYGWPELDLACSDMERFFEKVIKRLEEE